MLVGDFLAVSTSRSAPGRELPAGEDCARKAYHQRCRSMQPTST